MDAEIWRAHPTYARENRAAPPHYSTGWNGNLQTCVYVMHTNTTHPALSVAPYKSPQRRYFMYSARQAHVCYCYVWCCNSGSISRWCVRVVYKRGLRVYRLASRTNDSLLFSSFLCGVQCVPSSSSFVRANASPERPVLSVWFVARVSPTYMYMHISSTHQLTHIA